MAIIQNWFPPTRENYHTILKLWSLFPLFASLQWLTSWYGMGKTSVQSRLNLPGRVAWITMELPGSMTLLYTMWHVSERLSVKDLPWQNKVLAGLFCIHYAYRAVLFPLLAPSMSPIHVLVFLSALTFQLVNGTLIGAWLGGYGNNANSSYWGAGGHSPLALAQFVGGVALFYVGLATNYMHDDELREIRRREVWRRQRKEDDGSGDGKQRGLERNGKGKGMSEGQSEGNRDEKRQGSNEGSGAAKHYQIPTAALFRYLLYPHYLAEWIEWTGFWIACGFGCAPAALFVVNEVASMLPRAVAGRRWYVEKFGKDKVGKRWTVLPGLL